MQTLKRIHLPEISFILVTILLYLTVWTSSSVMVCFYFTLYLVPVVIATLILGVKRGALTAFVATLLIVPIVVTNFINRQIMYNLVLFLEAIFIYLIVFATQLIKEQFMQPSLEAEENVIMMSKEALEALQQITAALGQKTAEADDVIPLILDATYGLFRCHSCGILLMEEETGALKVKATRGADLQPLQLFQSVAGKKTIRQAVNRRESVLVSDFKVEKRFQKLWQTESKITVLLAPLVSNGKTLGFMYLTHRKSEAYTNLELNFFTIFANSVSCALGKEKAY